MVASSIVVNSITPNLNILGNDQKILFADPTNNFSFISNFNPLLNVPSLLKTSILNVFNNGYVFEHLTTTTNNLGSLKLKSTLNNNTVDILSIDNNIFTFSVPVIVPTPTLDSHAVNKLYVDTSTILPSRLAGYPGTSSVFLRGDGTWASAGGGNASLSGNSINVNTDGGSTNWLRRDINTTTYVQVYGLTNSGYIIENSNSESAGIGFDGSNDACTIWTAGDSGSYLNIQDEDTPNIRVAYVANNGAWTQVSSQKRKHSIKAKSNNNVLERFLKLSIKSYGYKYAAKKNQTKKQKKRIEKKSNKMAIGLILEELFEVFPNCIPDYYNKMFQDKRNEDLVLQEEIKDFENSGIDYNTLICYFIMAFQEYVKKTDNLISDLQAKLNSKKI